MHGNELRAEVFRVIIECRVWRRHGVERLSEMLFVYGFVQVARYRIKIIEIVQLIAVLVRDAHFRKHFADKAVDRHAAHRADMHPA